MSGVSRQAWFNEQLRKFNRIAITGGPKSGKTTLARISQRPVIHTDDYIGRGWSEASADIAKEVNDYKGAVIVEGVAVPRALRKGMNVDAVVFLDVPLVDLTPRQEAMRKSVDTVIADWSKSSNGVAVLIAPRVNLDSDKE